VSTDSKLNMNLSGTLGRALAAVAASIAMAAGSGATFAQTPKDGPVALHGINLSMSLQQAQAVLQAEFGPLNWKSSEERERGQFVSMFYLAHVNPDLEVSLATDQTGKLLRYFRQQQIRSRPLPVAQDILAQAAQKFGEPFYATVEQDITVAGWGADTRGRREPPNRTNEGTCRLNFDEPPEGCAWLLQLHVTGPSARRSDRVTLMSWLRSPALEAQAAARAQNRAGAQNQVRF
jgi:hypothetical protein